MRLINVDKAIEDIGDGVYTGSKIRRWLKSLPSAVQPELAQCCGDIISRQAAIDTLKELTANGTNKGMIFGEDAVHRIEILPSVQPDIIRCKDCVNYIDHRCVVADHHVAPFSCCQDVFNARRRGEHDG